MDNFTPFSALMGGALIGISATILLLFNGRIAGISGIMAALLRPKPGETLWRVVFLIGIVMGTFAFNYIEPNSFIPRTDYPIPLLIVGGFLVGFGTRMGSGCTSGHGVCGIARGSKRSIAATIAFMLTGFLTVFVIRHVMSIFG